MFSNIEPFICSNINEFLDERNCLREITFPKLKYELEKLDINFEPFQFDWCERDDCAKSGNLLRLLLHNVKNSPFFICLLGQQYGPYQEENKPRSGSTFVSGSSGSKFKNMSWMEKNLFVASQTGYNHLINHFSYNQSFLEYQINAALLNEENYPYYRFYYRKSEFLETKFEHLSIEERKNAYASYDFENEYCESSIKALKLRIIKKGIVVKYYDSLEQLHELIYEDLVELIQDFLKKNLRPSKSKQELSIDIMQFNKLNNYIFTESLSNLLSSLDSFCRKETIDLYKNNDKSSIKTDDSLSTNEQEQTEEYREILKLRHQNMSKSNSNLTKKRSSTQIFLIHAPQGRGKTSLILYIYRNLQKFSYSTFLDKDTSQYTHSRSITRSGNKTASTPTEKKELKPFYLFYFLKSQDLIVTILIDIICKMRAKYTNKDSSWVLNKELHDINSIVEQFHACLRLGPSIIFIDGLSEIENLQRQNIKLSQWLPKNIESNSKFVITVRKSTECFSELSTYSSTISDELTVFKADDDYLSLFAKLLETKNTSFSHNNTNLLYSKFLTLFTAVKSANHASNPLFIKILAKELFCFDHEIYKSHPMFARKSAGSSLFSNDSRNDYLFTENPVIDSYMEDVSTIREIIQRIINRYLVKRYNWSTRSSLPISKDNPGWVGEVLCLIALSIHGINKKSVFNILKMHGYHDALEVSDLNWQIFRMQFGFFIYEGFNGSLVFSHDYFKEAVRALLLDGLNVTSEAQSDPNMPPCKQNISDIQRDLHISIICNILMNQLNKEDFDFSSQIENNSELDNSTEFSQKYLVILHELIHHLYMIYDLVNLCKFLTNFKVLHIFYENRTNNLFEWFDFCNYLKLTTNLNVVRIILLSSFTIGIPQYEIIIRDENLYFKLINDEQTESSNITSDQKTETSSKKNLQEKIITNLKEHSSSSFQNKSGYHTNTRTSVTSIGVTNELYETYIDELLDLSDIVDLTENKYGDTINLILINRALILIDLMKNLDDEYFLENFAFKLGKLIDNIVTQNYPLNSTEKFKYSILLETLANISIQMNDYESSLRYFIKCIEILDDLYAGFHMVELSKKFKTKMQLYQISNRLSILQSNMALLLLKMNNTSAANAVLSKANRFNADLGNKATENLQLETIVKEKTIEHDIDLQVKNDENHLVYQEPTESRLQNTFKKPNQFKHEDASVMEAKFSYFFTSGLYEVQSMNFQNANNYFQHALNLTLKWFGPHHTNTSKIYHYYGCFYSLRDMKYYNPRRAELFLRKALFIREKFKESPNADYKLKNNFLSTVNTNFINSNENILNSERLTDRTSCDQSNFSSRTTKLNNVTDQNNSKPTVTLKNEEQNSIAEILFDLGSLLSTHDNNISKKEALDYIRRALDIKILLLGSDHSDCMIINKKLNETVLDYTSNFTRSTSRNGLPLSRTSSAFKNTNFEITPKIKLKRYLNEMKKQAQLKSNGGYNELDKWIEENSLIEKIPSRFERNTSAFSEKLRLRQVNQSQEISFEEQFMHSFDYTLDESNNTRGSNRDQADNKHLINLKNQSNNNFNKQNRANTSRPSLDRSKSFNNVNDYSKKTKRETTSSIHTKRCKCPTAVSVDIHNTRTVTAGPHSSIKNLLNPSVINTNDRTKLNYQPQSVQAKILKHIYYKSVWYDVPAGSSMRRYKNYVKVSPNV